MDVALSGRMGGPEIGANYLVGVVQVRPRLKAALADLSVQGVASINVELWISGSITDYCEGEASSSVKFFSMKGLLVLSVCIPQREAEALIDDDAGQVVAAWIAQGFELAALPRSACAVEYSAIVGAVRSSLSE
ncbi:hypothetical protein [Stenotrophomonas sp. GZD-301]|uniref:hypothetical protein n=1 Tax=Stenotrophomonas sp. GZD-301 TaxID=3404814 RepID=UPI003BB5EB8F